MCKIRLIVVICFIVLLFFIPQFVEGKVIVDTTDYIEPGDYWTFSISRYIRPNHCYQFTVEPIGNKECDLDLYYYYDLGDSTLILQNDVSVNSGKISYALTSIPLDYNSSVSRKIAVTNEGGGGSKFRVLIHEARSSSEPDGEVDTFMVLTEGITHFDLTSNEVVQIEAIGAPYPIKLGVSDPYDSVILLTSSYNHEVLCTNEGNLCMWPAVCTFWPTKTGVYRIGVGSYLPGNIIKVFVKHMEE